MRHQPLHGTSPMESALPGSPGTAATLARTAVLGLAALSSMAGTVALAACTRDEPSPAPATEAAMTLPAIAATNAFYYYRDLDSAWQFYTHVLGLETVADFGFAKILRVAPSSYLTLVDEEGGMHSADDPKSVTLAMVTEEVEGWWAYLSDKGVPMRAQLQEVDLARPYNGFVAMDPEGYLLEFERFNPHEQNTELLPRLAAVEPLGPASGVETTRPEDLRIQATVLWLYYHDIDAALAWYESVLDTKLLVDQGWAKVVPVSATGQKLQKKEKCLDAGGAGNFASSLVIIPPPSARLCLRRQGRGSRGWFAPGPGRGGWWVASRGLPWPGR